MDPRGPTSVESTSINALLLRWLSRQLTAEAMGWLTAELDHQRMSVDERRLALSLGRVGRKVGRMDLTLEPDDELAAQRLRTGWQPRLWGTDEAARVALLIATYRGDDQPFAARIDRLCTTAEVTEHVAYLKGLAVFPAGRQLHDRAREGVRSSIGPVFEAIACHNPYPFDYFDEGAWNQMVVKCVFTGTPINSIVGLEQRRNPELVQMLRDLMAERRAAGRSVPDVVHTYVGSG